MYELNVCEHESIPATITHITFESPSLSMRFRARRLRSADGDEYTIVWCRGIDERTLRTATPAEQQAWHLMLVRAFGDTIPARRFVDVDDADITYA